MKLHSLKIKQIVAKVLYLLASQLCTLANRVLDKMINQVLSQPFDYDKQVSDNVNQYLGNVYQKADALFNEGGEQNDS